MEHLFKLTSVGLNKKELDVVEICQVALSLYSK
jgi:hypothetical protein